LHVFPRFVPAACFRALGTGCGFSALSIDSEKSVFCLLALLSTSAWYRWCFFCACHRCVFFPFVPVFLALLVNCTFCFKLRLNHCAVSVDFGLTALYYFWVTFYSVVFLSRTPMLTFHIPLASDEMRCGIRTGLK